MCCLSCLTTINDSLSLNPNRCHYPLITYLSSNVSNRFCFIPLLCSLQNLIKSTLKWPNPNQFKKFEIGKYFYLHPPENHRFCFFHLILRFWFLVTFGYEVTKILKENIHNLCLQRQDGQDGNNREKITQLKWPKYQKPDDENMGWTKLLCQKNF